MKSTRYLYDIEPSVIASMKYEDALRFKIECAKILTGKLLEPQYEIRDTNRLNDVISARKFNEALLKELEAVHETDVVETGVFIGRFQPFHDGHQKAIEYMIQNSMYPVIIIGSSDTYGTKRNPYHISDRIHMLRSVFMEKYPFLKIYAIPDCDSDELWMEELEHVLLKTTNRSLSQVTIFTYDKDEDRKDFEYKGRKFENELFSKVYDVEGIRTRQIPNTGIKISGTQIRNNLEDYKHYLDDRVYKIAKNL